MLGEYALPAWTLLCVTVGVVLGYATTRATAENVADDSDSGLGAKTADELDP